MSHFLRIAAWLVLVSSSALAQGIYGASSGLVLEAWPNATPLTCPANTCCGGTELIVSEGTYYIAGSSYALSPAAAGLETVYSGGVLADGGFCGPPPALTADTPYYCYQTQCPSLVCTNTAPWPNGQPSAAIPIDGGASGRGQDAIFVGSFLTDNAAHVIPERRIAEELLIKVPADGGVTISIPVAGGPTVTFSAAIATCVWPRIGANCTNIQGVPQTDSFKPFYPASASAGVFDVHVLDTNAVVRGGIGNTNLYGLIKFYDPVSYFNFPGPLKSTQAEIGIAGTAIAGNAELETVRLTLNANELPPPYSAQFNTTVRMGWGDVLDPDQPAGTVAVAVLRGFIEPIQRLSSR